MTETNSTNEIFEYLLYLLGLQENCIYKIKENKKWKEELDGKE